MRAEIERDEGVRAVPLEAARERLQVCLRRRLAVVRHALNALQGDHPRPFVHGLALREMLADVDIAGGSLECQLEGRRQREGDQPVKHRRDYPLRTALPDGGIGSRCNACARNQRQQRRGDVRA
ncbi:MAG TPA: hypothetical protein VEU78_11015 [Steroidobacteraceae bacterium]|nr:hypothetical protein [Steroidobacteraceae bacterium]